MDPKFRVLLFRDSPARPPDSAARPRTFQNINSPPPCAPSLTTTAHFVGSGHFQAVNPSREHTLHAPDIRSDIRFGPWRRCSHRCSHLLGSRGQSYSTCQRRHGRNLMSDRTSGAWRVCSLDGVTAWKCPGSLMPALTVSPRS